MRRRALIAGLAVAVLGAAFALASGGRPAPSAVARALPAHYRLALTEVFDRGRLHVAYYGRGRRDPADAPISIYSVRGHAKPSYEYSPDRQPGDRATTVRGHPAVLRPLSEEDGTYARELIWRERSDLVVAVFALKWIATPRLRRVAEHVRVVGQRAWASLYRQTSYRAQIGRPTKYMRRVRVRRGVIDGHRWRLFALIPPHFPLSRNDLRVPCFELRYRKRRTHGDGCGFVPSWRRVGGSVFTFGAVPRHWKRLSIRPWQGHAFKVRARTVAIRRGPRVRYFATPLPENACAVVIAQAKHPRAEGPIAAPIEGRDQRRCASRATRP
jgi:hypothetical protein